MAFCRAREYYFGKCTTAMTVSVIEPGILVTTFFKSSSLGTSTTLKVCHALEVCQHDLPLALKMLQYNTCYKTILRRILAVLKISMGPVDRGS
jgi:hypothetical protein